MTVSAGADSHRKNFSGAANIEYSKAIKDLRRLMFRIARTKGILLPVVKEVPSTIKLLYMLRQ